MKTFNEIISEKIDYNKMDKEFGYAIDILHVELSKMGFKKTGKVLTIDKKKVQGKMSFVHQLVNAINLLSKRSMIVKQHKNFVDIV